MKLHVSRTDLKHGVSFEEASSCFFDPENRYFVSPTRKGGEARIVV